MHIGKTILLLQAVVTLALTADNASAARPRIGAGVHRTLKQQATVNIIVTMRDEAEKVLESLPHEASFASRGDMITDMVGKLEAHAKTSQADITKLMANEASTQLASEVRSFWISNQVFFRDATFQLVEKLASMGGVLSIEEEAVMPLSVVASTNISTAAVSSQAAPQWGISKIRAPDVWAQGYTGQGVVVSSIDTGVRATHEILRGNFRKDFGWFDPSTLAAEAYDDVGHGTHIMGTIAGWGSYGVAPGATWITCKGCRGEKCWQADVLACAQFITCPTNPSGTIKDCSKAPRVVNNSWGGVGSAWAYASTIRVWRRAGIIPVMASGNYGPGCTTLASPGDDPNVIGVGATDSSDGLASVSSKGPTRRGLMKPDLSAPGVNVMSAISYSDTSYVELTGTSTAAPHVAGAIALLLSSEPTLVFDQVRSKLLYDNTDRSTLKPADQVCEGSQNGLFPNSMYGHGRLNVLKAVNTKRAPVAGQCPGLDANDCNAAFFCMWSNTQKNCQRWW